MSSVGSELDDAVTAGMSKTQYAYLRIKRAILAGKYSPGYRLVVSQLSTEFEVSLVPIREAIRLLEAEGLVTVVHNVGAHVADHQSEEYPQMMEAFGILEGAAVALAAPHITEETLRELEKTNDVLRGAVEVFSPQVINDHSALFHELLYRDCPNAFLLDLVAKNWMRVDAVRGATFGYIPGRVDVAVDYHDRIIELIRTKAATWEIESLMRDHRRASTEQFIQYSEEHARSRW